MTAWPGQGGRKEVTLCDRLAVSASSSFVTMHLSLVGGQVKDEFSLLATHHGNLHYSCTGLSGPSEVDTLDQ